MSLGTQFTIWCDSVRDTDERTSPPGCEHWIGNEDSAQEARQLARRAGWTHVAAPDRRDSRDYCRACTKRREGSANG